MVVGIFFRLMPDMSHCSIKYMKYLILKKIIFEMEKALKNGLVGSISESIILGIFQKRRIVK